MYVCCLVCMYVVSVHMACTRVCECVVCMYECVLVHVRACVVITEGVVIAFPPPNLSQFPLLFLENDVPNLVNQSPFYYFY